MKVGLIGYGYWGRILSRYIHDNEEITLYKIYDYKGRYNDSIFTTELDDLLECEAVFIATPLETHFAYMKKFIENGIHIFCEKPLVQTIEEYDYIKSASRNVIIFTDYTMIYSDGFKKFKSILNNQNDHIVNVEMNFKQFGKFYNSSVYKVLGSHMVAAIVDLFPNERFIFSKSDQGIFDEQIDIGRIIATGERFNCIINVSVRDAVKSRNILVHYNDKVILYNPISGETIKIIYKDGRDESVYTYDETQNLNNSVQAFVDSIRVNDTYNLLISKTVTEAII